MPVTGLEKYIEKIPDATYAINLRDLIKLLGHEKTVLLDASSVQHTICKKLQYLSYFQPKLFKAGVHKYIENILSTGSKLILIIGYFPEKNFSEKFSYFQQNSLKIIESLESLKEGNDEKFKTFDLKLKIYNDCVINTLLEIQNDNYKILMSNEQPQKIIIDYIKENNCSSLVIADNSNFIIYEESFLYVKGQNIDFETLDCIAYDKNKILQFFDLASHELPIFATLCGNEVIERIFLKSFHKKINAFGHSFQQSVARYVKNNQNLEKKLKYLVNEINSDKINEKLLKNSLDMYKKNTNNQKLFNQAFSFEDKRLGYHSEIFKIIFSHENVLNLCLENLKDSSIISCIDLFKNLRKKLYGILLYEDFDKTVKECYCTFSEICKKKVNFVKAILPTAYHPGLESLWQNRGDGANEVKMKLMLSTVSSNLDFSHIKIIPDTLLIPVLALRYLCNEIPKITGNKYFTNDFEVKAFLTVALLITKNDESFNDNNDYEVPDYRALDLSTKFKNCCHLMYLLNEACGFVIKKHKSCLCNYFDDILFQKIYKKYKAKDPELLNFTANNNFINHLLKILN